MVNFADLNLPLGRIRVRPSGSSGGHNGLRSIEAALTTAEYPRLRLGIGESVESTVVDHVLAPFDEEEREVLVPALDRAVQASIAWLGGEDVPSLMSRFNGGETPEPDTPDTPPTGNTDLE